MRIHVTGVSGTGMGSLAGLLVELGHSVSGSDTAFYPPMGPRLVEWGIELFEGYSAEHLRPELHGGKLPDAVVVGNVCRRDNPEAVAAIELGIERLHIGSALGRFALSGTAPVVVAGTHGKTTTSSMVAHLLDGAGLEPGFLIGGVPQGFGRGFRRAGPRRLARVDGAAHVRKPPFVLEGDEYDTAFWEKTAKFLHYGAEVAIITSIEHDHVDIYPTFDDYQGAFQRFVGSLPETGLLIVHAGDEHAVRLSQESPAPVTRYGVAGHGKWFTTPEWYAEPVISGPEGTTFDLFAGGVLAGRYLCPLSGLHNVANATAALAAAAHGYGCDLRSLKSVLARFGGVKRRQELRGTPSGISVYDDFAHHPTAVEETLHALSLRNPDARLLVLFEPRSATACRRTHQDAYTAAFDRAAHVLFAPVGRELPDAARLDVPLLARSITERGIPAEALGEVDELVHRAAELARPGDAVVVLSNGAFGGIVERLLACLARQSVAESPA